MTQQNIEEIRHFLKINNPQAALEVIEVLLTSDPENFEINFLKGRSLLALKEYEHSEKIFLELLIKTPNNLNCILSLCESFAQLGKFGASIACITKAIEIIPNNINFCVAKSRLYESQIKKNNKEYIVKDVTNHIFDSHLLSKEVIILCGGEARRWKSHLGIKHKHLIPVEGEILLDRTLKQVLKYKPSKITVLVRPGDHHCFEKICAARAIVKEIPILEYPETPAWKYLSSENYWNQSGITISLLGDVWFSDEAIDRIFKNDSQDWLAFGRSSSSQFTGCKYGEIFAHKFSNHHRHLISLRLLNALYRSRLCNAHASGWALSQLISNEDPNIKSVGKNFVEIDDFTEDFDFPRDYERWVANRSRLNSTNFSPALLEKATRTE